MYTVLPEIAMKPADAYDQLVRGEVEAVSIDALPGRVAAVMLVPYPPGIPIDHAGRTLYRVDPVDYRLPGICPHVR
jgi:arginine/lysine/ornithine decarboxylase